MNVYGPMKESLRRVAAYQGADIHHMPGHGEHFYRVCVQDGDRYTADVFEIKNDGHLNRVLNILTLRALA